MKTWRVSSLLSKRWRIVAGVSCAMLLTFTVTSAQPPADQRKQLDAIQQQLREKREGYQQMQGEERNLLKELQTIEYTLQQQRQTLQTHRSTLEQQTTERQKLQQNLQQFEEQNQRKQQMVATRIRAIYKMGDLGYIAPLLAMSSESDVQQQIKYLQTIAQHDVQLMKASRRDMQTLISKKDALEKKMQAIAETTQKIEQQEQDITAQKQQKTALLQRIQNDKEQFAQAIKTLEVSAGKLEEFFVKLDVTPTEPAAAPSQQPVVPEIHGGKEITFPSNANDVVRAYGAYFRVNKGKLLWPAQGKIMTQFGNIKVGETYTFYKGVDIQAKNGTPFYAVFKGTVKYADWFEGYGNLIILDHGGNFYTLYAHANEIVVKPGQVVEARQALGKVGDTDSLKGSHLYFEIRANGKPENPQLWLAKVQ